MVYEADLEQPYAPALWTEGERLLVIGPDNLEPDLDPRIAAFLGGAAYECVSGIRGGDRLFIVADAHEYLHRGYIILSGQARKLIWELEDVPVIGYCYTVAAARGRGLYRRALIAEMEYLRELGYRRVVIDTEPGNHASRKGIEAAGFVFVRTVSSWIVLSLFAIQRMKAGSRTHSRLVFFGKAAN